MDAVRTVLLHRGEGGRLKKVMILEKSKWKCLVDAVRTVLLHRGEGGRLKKVMILEK